MESMAVVQEIIDSRGEGTTFKLSGGKITKNSLQTAEQYLTVELSESAMELRWKSPEVRFQEITLRQLRL